MSRRLLTVIPLAVALASCGGASDSRHATRAQPAARRTLTTGVSPDAGIPQGHAVADDRARRCRAAHPPRRRWWRYCDRYAR